MFRENSIMRSLIIFAIAAGTASSTTVAAVAGDASGRCGAVDGSIVQLEIHRRPDGGGSGNSGCRRPSDGIFLELSLIFRFITVCTSRRQTVAKPR